MALIPFVIFFLVTVKWKSGKSGTSPPMGTLFTSIWSPLKLCQGMKLLLIATPLKMRSRMACHQQATGPTWNPNPWSSTMAPLAKAIALPIQPWEVWSMERVFLDTKKIFPAMLWQHFQDKVGHFCVYFFTFGSFVS